MKGKEKKKTTKLRIKEGLTCKETQRKKEDEKETKPEECDIKEKKLLCYIQATVNGDFSWVHIKLFATSLTRMQKI